MKAAKKRLDWRYVHDLRALYSFCVHMISCMYGKLLQKTKAEIEVFETATNQRKFKGSAKKMVEKVHEITQHQVYTQVADGAAVAKNAANASNTAAEFAACKMEIQVCNSQYVHDLRAV